jgi:hypothetical protein
LTASVSLEAKCTGSSLGCYAEEMEKIALEGVELPAGEVVSSKAAWLYYSGNSDQVTRPAA